MLAHGFTVEILERLVLDGLATKNRKRESCTSGTVRDEDGNILIYSAGRKGLYELIPADF